MAPLPWLPEKLVKEASDWTFTGTVQHALGSLAEAGQEVMKPVGQQLASLLPAPQPAPAPAQTPAVTPFTLPDITAWGFGAPSPAQPAAAPTASEGFSLHPETSGAVTATVRAPARSTGGFSLPGPEAWGMGGSTASTGTPAPSPTQAGPASRPAEAPSDVNEYLRYAANKAGIDPGQVLAVMGKEGPTGWGSVGTFDTGTSFGPLQLHYSGGPNPKAGMGDDFTRDTGVDLRRVDPKTPEGIAAHQRAVDYALDRLSKTGDFREWYGAEPALGSRFTKVKRVAPTQEPASPAAMAPDGVPTAVAEGAGWRETWGKNLTPHQINETLNLGLSWDAALATCGIAASIAFARANGGRTPTFKEALDLAQKTGEWTQSVGMTRGTTGQLALLKGLGVDAEARPLNEQEIARTVTAGQPVQINAHGNGGHFYVAQGYDPQTGRFDFGNSAAILKRAGGNTWFTLSELPSLGVGSPSEAIFLRGR